MFRLRFFMLWLTVVGSVFAQVDTAWVRRYYVPGNVPDQAFGVAVDGRGNAYVTGSSGTNADYATIKYGPDGDSLWVRRYNGPGNGSDIARAIAVDATGSVYVTGGSYGGSTVGDYATIKYSPSGDEQWVRRYDGPRHFEDYAQAIALDGAGNVYVTGSSSGSGTGYDYATVKYDSSGVEQWARRYNGPGNSDDYALAIAADNLGNAYVTGRSPASGTDDDYATIKYSPAGESLWVQRYDGPANDHDQATAIAVDDSGFACVTGYSLASDTDYDYATIKYSPSGGQQWAARYDGPPNQNDYARAIAVDAAGSVYVTGESYYSSFDYATVKYGPAGESLWAKRYNGPDNYHDYATAIAVDDSGSVYVTGRSSGVGSGSDYATIKYVQTQSGIEEARLSHSADRTPLAIYPNPAKAVIRARWSSSGENATAIRIFDGAGKLVNEIAVPAAQTRNNGEEVVSLKGIDPGIYFLRFGTETRKFLVMK